MTSVLLIDDELDVRDSVAKVLGREGYHVETASNAMEGLEIHSGKRFDILITDIIMAGVDGVEAIRKIREADADIKIVAISGGGNFGPKDYEPNAITTTAYLQAAAEAGADSVLTKPFVREDLIDTLRALAPAT